MTCIVEKCTNKIKAKNLCSKHYERLRVHGNVTHSYYNESYYKYRFWSKVHIKTKDECWEWQASKNEHGYGLIRFDTVLYKAHRVSWFYTFGTWSELLICHKCDNPSCVNPNHLFEGTHLDNTIDMVSKNRNRNQYN